MKHLDFPLRRQEGDNWCWAAVTEGQLHFSPANSHFPNQALTQCQIAGLVRASSMAAACVNPEAFDVPESLTKALNVVGRLRGSGVGVAEFAHIQSEIAAGRPICARIVRDDDKNGRVDGAHFVVIVGWKIQDGTPHVSIADPLLESSEWMPLETFRTNYRFQGVWQATYYMKD